MAAHRRYADTLMDQKAYGRGTTAPMVDLKHGGHMGHMPEYPDYISSAPYVRRNLIIKLISAPRGFLLLPEPEKWVETLKALLEVHPVSVTGFNSQLNVEMRDSAFGGAGERQEVVANVTRARVQPVFNYVEKYGRPITTFFDRWVTELLMDPNSKFPNVVTRVKGRTEIIDALPDFTGCVFIAFEPDPTFTKIDKAWLVAGSMPKDDLAPQEGVRDLQSGGDTLEFPINMTGVAQTGPAVNAVALKFLQAMTTVGASPLARNAFTDEQSGEVIDATTGYDNQLRRASTDSVPI